MTMNGVVFEEMKQYVGFGEEDAANLRALATAIEPRLPRVVDRFYQEVRRHPGARQALAESKEQGDMLQRTLLRWLRGLFCGVYDADYAHHRALIGRAHVRIGLPQHFMIVALEVVWQELEQAVRETSARQKAAKLAALHKLLTLDAALMLESYRESYTVRVRQVERDAIRARLNEAEQMAQIGHLAASLAHEIKNPLAGISGAIQVIRDSLTPDQPHWPVLGEVLRQINRLDRTVKDLLVYARPKPPQYRRCEIKRVIERVLTLLRKEPECERVRFECNGAADVPPIAADENLLEQLLMNLMLNAAQASREGGVVRLLTAPQGRGLRLIVADRGCGMTPDVARRATEPFFTTKARGTGLGLSICRKIVAAHGGTMSIRSEPGQGTEVVVELAEHPPAAAAGATDEDSRSDR